MSRKELIIEKLSKQFNPSYLLVEDETKLHHTQGAKETHFKIIIVSTAFANQALIKRHRQIYELLEMKPADSLHALSLLTLTEEEWARRQNSPLKASPPCRGGFAQEKANRDKEASR